MPYGHTVLDKRVWEARFARTLLLISFLAFFGGYVAVMIECFRYSKGTEYTLALTGLVSSAVGTVILIAMYTVALFPYRWLDQALDEIRAEAAD